MVATIVTLRSFVGNSIGDTAPWGWDRFQNNWGRAEYAFVVSDLKRRASAARLTWLSG